MDRIKDHTISSHCWKTQWLQRLFWGLFLRPFLLGFIGVNRYHVQRLNALINQDQQVILVANHNSHLDTLILMTLFPDRLLHRIHPIAAADYFLTNPLLSWFALTIMNIVPIPRKKITKENNPITKMEEALAKGDSLILFPEGSRGNPEVMKPFQNGIGHLIARNPHIPVVPVFIRGAGRSLPKGEMVILPMFCDVVIGDPLRFDDPVGHDEQIDPNEAPLSKQNITQRLEDEVFACKAWLEAETFSLESQAE
jgi:1-acyl-sn-glycerol-3-phosphate acyltransferase